MKELIAQAVDFIDEGANAFQLGILLGNEALKPFVQGDDFGTVSVLMRVFDAANALIADRELMTTGYRGYKISYNPKPVPSRKFDYDFAHEDYDGPGDHRFGYAESIQSCVDQIEEFFLKVVDPAGVYEDQIIEFGEKTDEECKLEALALMYGCPTNDVDATQVAKTIESLEIVMEY